MKMYSSLHINSKISNSLWFSICVNLSTPGIGAGLTEILDLATRESPLVQSTQLEVSATKVALKAQDLALAPILSADANVSQDKTETLSRPSTDQGPKAALLSSIKVPFSTGTKFQLDVEQQRLLKTDSQTSRDATSWNARLSQSLVKDSFGRETKLRRQSEQIELSIKELEAKLQTSSLLIQVEQSYWDFLNAVKQKSIHQKNLERRLTLEKWTSQRINQFAAETQDLLQVQTILGQTRLNVMSAEDQKLTAISKLKLYVPSLNENLLPQDTGELERDRSVIALFTKASSEPTSSVSTPIKIDTLLALQQWNKLKVEIDQTEQTLKPNLDGYVQYGSGAVGSGSIQAWSNSTKGKTNSTAVGLALTMTLDQDLKNDKIESVRLKAQSQQLRASTSREESRLEWLNLIRRVDFLRRQA
ncbi:MAG: TolC family protein, partial [Proteobacteria bacterium]|nr:TolC family protein [Pseudomonadota bacterium]